MFLIGFLAAASFIIAGLGAAVQFRNYRRDLGLWILAASALALAHLWIGYAILHSFEADWTHGYWRLLLAIDGLFSLAICHIAGGFFASDMPGLRERGIEARFLGWLRAFTGLGVLIAFLPRTLIFLSQEIPLTAPMLSGLGLWIPAALAMNATYTLYLLENKYRFAHPYQRRIGRLAFIGIGFLSAFHLLQFGRALLYNTLHDHYPEASSVIYAVVFPVVLAGFFRYRLGSESISVPRGTVYSSVTLLLVGAVFLGMAATAAALQAFGVGFGYFEVFLGVFTFSFLSLLALGSGTMRRRISRFINSQLYSQKYDYKEQFFQLHRTLHSGSPVAVALVELIENMKYSVSVGDAHCFIRDPRDGQFYEQRNKEESMRPRMVLSGDSALIENLAKRPSGIDLFSREPGDSQARATLRRDEVDQTLKADAAFPIRAGNSLLGVLFLSGGRKSPFDDEDMVLIDAFAQSIGDALFKDRVMRERIEQKQFESFHHIASFIVHDIKNQVATLNLLLKNAERNIANPSFQESMLRSVGSCAGGLQSLVDRLAVAPRGEGLRVETLPLKPLLDNVAAQSGLMALPDWTYAVTGDEVAKAHFDPKALFFVVKNLVQNALEASGPSGKLDLHCGHLDEAARADLRSRYGGGARFFSGYAAYLLVRDAGPGMDADFLRLKLFQPFATTKEKGVGIGLYQCKTLVEKMGGSILCRSIPGQGTEFCILLPGAEPAGLDTRTTEGDP